MSTIADNILAAVLHPLAVEHHQITNDSHQHSGPATDSHFSLLLVSKQFNGLTPVKRHQQVYALVDHLMGNPINALVLHCYTPEQWAQKQAMPAPPRCMSAQY